MTRPASQKHQSLVVTIKTPSGARSQVWNTEQPLALGHPFKWIIERTQKGVRVRNLAEALDVISRAQMTELTQTAIDQGADIQLPDPISIHLQPVRELSAPFKSAVTTPDHLRIFACVGNWVMHSEPVGSGCKAKFRGEEIFTLQQKGASWSIQPTVDSLMIASQTGSAQATNKGQTIELAQTQILTTTITHGPISWRFDATNSPTLSGAIDHGADEEANRWFGHSLKGSAIALASLLFLAWLMPKTDPKNEELIPAQYAKIVLAVPAKQVEANNAPSSNAAPAAPGKEVPKTVQKAAVVQAFRAQALQNSMSSLLKGGMTNLLAQSDFVAGTAQSANARTMFNTKSQDLVATASETGAMNARSVKVGAMGGEGKGVGYGKGERAGVSGQGKSFVSMDMGGSDVQEGLTKEQVGEVIHRHLSEVRYCYESAMIRAPDIEGKLMVAFVIGGNGMVKSTAVKQSTLSDPRLDDCILRRLVTWKFPLPKGGVDVAVSYPFIFKTLGR